MPPSHDAAPQQRPSAEDLLEMIRVIPDVLFRCHKGPDGRIYWSLNEGRLAEEFHLTTKEIGGRSLEELFPGGASDQLKEHFEQAFAGDPHIFVNEIEGRYFKHNPQPVYGPDGKVEALVGYITEVTELVEAQNTLAQANADLDAFAHTLTHDLRSPLSVIVNTCYALDARLAGEAGAEAAEGLGRIRRAAHRIDTLIDDVLRFSGATRRALRRRRLDVSALAREALETLAAEDPDRDVDWDVKEGLAADGDEGLVRIALENLLGNAWKYTGEQPRPRIRVAAVPDAAESTFVVEDNGIGFEPEEATGIFQAFGRLPAATRFDGTGVGLATVRRIVARHGGRVWADGEPGKGARFYVTLPSPPPGGQDSEVADAEAGATNAP